MLLHLDVLAALAHQVRGPRGVIKTLQSCEASGIECSRGRLRCGASGQRERRQLAVLEVNIAGS